MKILLASIAIILISATAYAGTYHDYDWMQDKCVAARIKGYGNNYNKNNDLGNIEKWCHSTKHDCISRCAFHIEGGDIKSKKTVINDECMSKCMEKYLQ